MPPATQCQNNRLSAAAWTDNPRQPSSTQRPSLMCTSMDLYGQQAASALRQSTTQRAHRCESVSYLPHVTAPYKRAAPVVQCNQVQLEVVHQQRPLPACQVHLRYRAIATRSVRVRHVSVQLRDSPLLGATACARADDVQQEYRYMQTHYAARPTCYRLCVLHHSGIAPKPAGKSALTQMTATFPALLHMAKCGSKWLTSC